MSASVTRDGRSNHQVTSGHPGVPGEMDLNGVFDVHTDLARPFLTGDPRAVIREAVGNVNLLMIAVDNGPDRMVYAGPVFSHCEFEEPKDTRLSDDQWTAMLDSSAKPAPSGWTQSYLVPRGQ